MRKLEAGDIIFFPAVGSFWDFFIRFVSPKYTHVGIYLNEEYIVDANLWTVEKRPFKKYPGVTVKRIRGINAVNAQALCDYVMWQSGESYSMLEAFLAGMKSLFRIPGNPEDDRDSHWHCAKLITKAMRNTLSVEVFPEKRSSDVFPDTLYAWDGFETIVVYE